MKQNEIIQIVVTHLGKHPLPIKEGLWLLHDKSKEDHTLKIYKGNSLDVLAEVIEAERYFGSYVPSSVEQVGNLNNSTLEFLENGRELNLAVTLKVEGEGLELQVLVDEIIPKKYLDDVRSKKDFFRAAVLYGVGFDEATQKILFS